MYVRLAFCPLWAKYLKRLIKAIQRHAEGRDLLSSSQFGFHPHHSTPLQCMRLTDHITLNFNSMSTAVVFLDTDKPLTQHGTLACYINCQELLFRPL
jgi:hypothetical protein